MGAIPKLDQGDKDVLNKMRDGGRLMKSAGELYWVRKERTHDLNMSEYFVNRMIRMGLIYKQENEYHLTELGKTIEL